MSAFQEEMKTFERDHPEVAPRKNTDFFDKRAADTLAREVAKLVKRGIIDSRSAVGDALLDYWGGSVPEDI